MAFLEIAVSIVGLVFMLTFMFIGIWIFIVGLKTYNQLRYKNYILEKINQKLTIIAHSKSKRDFDDFDEDVSEIFDITDLDNIKDFEKREFR